MDAPVLDSTRSVKIREGPSGRVPAACAAKKYDLAGLTNGSLLHQARFGVIASAIHADAAAALVGRQTPSGIEDFAVATDVATAVRARDSKSADAEEAELAGESCGEGSEVDVATMDLTRLAAGTQYAAPLNGSAWRTAPETLAGRLTCDMIALVWGGMAEALVTRESDWPDVLGVKSGVGNIPEEATGP